ncbi:Sphingosine N-acyltransferase-like protein [Lachnellula hyalina]|uniref:Sphingosine N-acyltransferase-like protein n=1 Tax=Lachnellula hyalina TaxID=1316788 RepID=A0A8H8R947_9HELO|nr:Sphingosine N-acyltransferase-like protein [Lachnellula hyalina]TVY29851.1 Sphingosine N-acyltransferase-like protein [Lachnellula hyalina]
MPSTEAFPLLSTTDKLAPLQHSVEVPRVRRRSSGLGGEIRAGDTRVPALATLDVRPPSPGTIKAQNESYRRKPFSKRRKAKSLFVKWKRYALKHTWVTPLALIGVFFALFAINPTESNPIHHFIFLSYKLPAEPGAPVHYGKGWWDFAFVTFYIIVLSFTREFIMQQWLRPMARRSGLKSRAKQSRFMEQMYTAIYFGVLGPCGLYVMSRTPVWYFNTRGMYEGFPHKTHEADFKFYYLFQAAYWAQQALVLSLGMEKPRKDYKELVGHHITTLFLIGLSYRCHFTYMGLAVYTTHDISDFFLATSKTLNYLDHPLVGPYFGFFIVAWCYLRHYLNLRILWSEFNEFKTVGPYELDWETEQYKCDLSHWISTFLLASLQGLNIFWLYYILRIAYRFLFYNVAEDDRSDNDENELAEEQRLDALSRSGVDAVAGPKVLLNGSPVQENGKENGKANGNANGKANGTTKVRTDGLTNRKTTTRKAARKA